ncbi:MAG: TolC family protein [Rikenellaceae bacterium]
MKKTKLRGVAALLLVCLISMSDYGYAQSTIDSLSMSLEECLDYAKENSITLQKAKLQIANSEQDQVSAKGAFLPTVSGYVSQSFNSNPMNTDIDATKSSYSGSYGVDLSLSLYSGGKNRALLQQSNVSYEASNLELEEFENSIEVSVTELYIEILYAMEQIDVAESTLEISERTLARGQAFFDAGSLNSAELAQLESSVATYKYNLVVAQTQLSNLYVALKHLLEISQDLVLTIKEPTISDELLSSYIAPMSDIYNEALVSRPEIKYNALMIESAEFDLTIAKAGYLPTLNLSAGAGLNHNSYSDFAFSSQLRNNFNASLGLSLSIPIFNGFKTRSSVAKAQNYITSANLDLTQAQKDLYQTIETLYNNVQTSQAMYTVSAYQLEALEKSLDLITQQYEVGMKTTLELLTEQDNYNQSSQDYLTNKYKLILNKALLNYYKSDVIKL